MSLRELDICDARDQVRSVAGRTLLAWIILSFVSFAATVALLATFTSGYMAGVGIFAAFIVCICSVGLWLTSIRQMADSLAGQINEQFRENGAIYWAQAWEIHADADRNWAKNIRPEIVYRALIYGSYLAREEKDPQEKQRRLKLNLDMQRFFQDRGNNKGAKQFADEGLV
jgi:hypothetical protein